MEIKQNYLTNNDCYKTDRKISPSGIMVHSTGCNQKKISAYTKQWDKSGVAVCVHAFIGLDDDGKLKVIQTLPWNHRAWGCGSGSKGSYNNSHIQFEICEDSLADKDYFNFVYQTAVELCAHLCKDYNMPIANITTHCDAHQAGYASNHADVMHWFPRHGKDMDSFRADVQAQMSPAINQTKVGWIEEGDRWWYCHEDGSYTKDNWEKIDGKWYHFDAEGWMQTGWLKDHDKWYYLKEDGDMAACELLTIQSAAHGSEVYAFAADGHMLVPDTKSDRGRLV